MIDVVLLTALATLAAFLYNVCSSLVGGVQLTLPTTDAAPSVWFGSGLGRARLGR